MSPYLLLGIFTPAKLVLKKEKKMKKICSYLMRQNQTQRTQPLSCCNGLLSSPLFEKKANLKRKPSLIRSSLLKLISSFGESDF
jgi:hypothetical protein